MSFFGVPFLALGALLAWVSLYFWREGGDLRAQGVEARALLSRKYRKPDDRFLLGFENRFVTAEFVDAQQNRRVVEIRVPSQQWHMLREGSIETIVYLPSNPSRARVISRPGQTVVGLILLFGAGIGVLFVAFGVFFLAAGVSPGGPTAASVPDPPPTQFDKSGVTASSMLVSPRHDRIIILDEKGAGLNLRDLASSSLLATTRGHAWRLLTWSPDGARLAVAEGAVSVVLDAATLRPAAGEAYSWNPESPALAAACPQSTPAWDAGRRRAAASCGNNILVSDANAVRTLAGHRDRVLGVAWSPSGRRLASVSDDNYVRVWDPETLRCLAVSEDYPYPRAIFFTTENSITVVDAALRRYTLAVPL